MRRLLWLAFATPVLLLAPAFAAAGTPLAADLELVTRTRAVLGEVRAFERLNGEIAGRCHEPVAGAYGDWREEFQADLERARALGTALQRRLAGRETAVAPDDRLKPFTEAEGQLLYSRCLRWSTLLIQRESPVRAELASRFAFLRDNETRIRAIVANDTEWQEWRAAGALP
jgi:hypothetical protein